MKFCYYWYQDIYKPAQIKKINKFILANPNPKLKDKPSDKAVKTAKVSVLDLNTLRNCEAMNNIEDLIDSTNNQFFNFTTRNFTRFDCVNHNIYKANVEGQYEWHYDGELFDKGYTSKLTALINLSEKEYEGGDFYIWWGEPLHVKEFKKPGAVLIFPSFMAHKVTPVTKGERITLAVWKKGPWWQ